MRLLILALAFALAVGGAGRVRDGIAAHPIGFLLSVSMALLNLWTSYLLAKRSRLGAISAVLLLAPPLAELAVGQHVSRLSITVALVGVAVVASVWRELYPDAV